MAHILAKNVLMRRIHLDKTLLVWNMFINRRMVNTETWFAIFVRNTHLEVFLSAVYCHMARCDGRRIIVRLGFLLVTCE